MALLVLLNTCIKYFSARHSSHHLGLLFFQNHYGILLQSYGTRLDINFAIIINFNNDKNTPHGRASPITFGPRINGRGTNKQGVAALGKAKQVGGSK